MIDEPKIVQTRPVRMASIHLTVKREKIQEVMVPGLQELMETLEAQGVTPTEPWFTHHFKMQPDIFDFEIAVPVEAEVKPAGRVKPGELPAMRAGRTVYHGAYEGLADGWGEFDAWITKNGHKIGPDLVEVYLVGPESGRDSSKWETELTRPLVD